MKIDVNIAIKDLKGEPTEAVVRDVIITSLLTMLKGDEHLGGQEKSNLYRLAALTAASDEPDYRVEDLTLIKERIGRAYPPLVVGRSYEILDPQAGEVAQ